MVCLLRLTKTQATNTKSTLDEIHTFTFTHPTAQANTDKHKTHRETAYPYDDFKRLRNKGVTLILTSCLC